MGGKRKLMNHFQQSKMDSPIMPNTAALTKCPASQNAKNGASALTIEVCASTATGDNPALDGENRQ
jgi:hypothetical protein